MFALAFMFSCVFVVVICWLFCDFGVALVNVWVNSVACSFILLFVVLGCCLFMFVFAVGLCFMMWCYCIFVSAIVFAYLCLFVMFVEFFVLGLVDVDLCIYLLVFCC